jgi:LPXTG-site transpeptidase (sortase) family protein
MKINKYLSRILILAGVLLMLYPLFTYLYSSYEQYKLKAAYNPPQQQQNTTTTEEQDPALTGGPPSLSFPTDGDFTGALIEIPPIGLSAALLRGTTPAILNKGPGWYEESALPGQGNTAIAGHRTMYGSWFRHLDSLIAGDEIKLTFDNWVYSYKVERFFIIANNDWSVIDPTTTPTLTLTTCHPVGSAAQRLVVRAALVSWVKI